MDNFKKAFSLELFADQLLEEKGADSLDEEIKATMKADLVSRLEDKVNAIILAALPPERLEDFSNLLDNNLEGMDEFLKNNIPGFEEVLAAGLLEFRNTYLS